MGCTTTSVERKTRTGLRPEGYPLPLAPRDRDLRVVRVAAGRALTERLAGMGMATGSLVRLVGGRPGGPVMVSHDGTRFAIGRGVAQKMMVVEVEE